MLTFLIIFTSLILTSLLSLLLCGSSVLAALLLLILVVRALLIVLLTLLLRLSIALSSTPIKVILALIATMCSVRRSVSK
jgi:hypothetical protein